VSVPRRDRQIGVRAVGFHLAVALLLAAIARGADKPDGEAWSLPSDFSGAVLVAQGDRLLVEQAQGFANAAARELNTTGTVFRIGSITKAITAAAVLRLAGEGRIALHDPIARVWPGWPPAWSAVTPHHLLVHTAGINDYVTEPDFPADWLPSISADALFRRFGQHAAPLPAGAVPAYSNSHYVLLGELAARAAGQNLATVLASRVFLPAGMKHSSLLSIDYVPSVRARGYTSDSETWDLAGELPPGLLDGAGAAAATVGDLWRFVRALTQSPGLLGERGRASLWTTHSGQQGYGWVAARPDGPTVWTCVGRLRGFSAALLHQPEGDLTVVVLANRDAAPAREIAFALLARARDAALPPHANSSK